MTEKKFIPKAKVNREIEVNERKRQKYTVENLLLDFGTERERYK